MARPGAAITKEKCYLRPSSEKNCFSLKLIYLFILEKEQNKKKNTATTNPVSRERKTKKNIGGDVGAGSKPEEVFVR